MYGFSYKVDGLYKNQDTDTNKSKYVYLSSFKRFYNWNYVVCFAIQTDIFHNFKNYTQFQKLYT